MRQPIRVAPATTESVFPLAGAPTECGFLVLLFGLVVSGQIRFRRLDGWRQIPACLACGDEAQDDASRIGVRIKFDGRTDTEVCP